MLPVISLSLKEINGLCVEATVSDQKPRLRTQHSVAGSSSLNCLLVLFVGRDAFENASESGADGSLERVFQEAGERQGWAREGIRERGTPPPAPEISWTRHDLGVQITFLPCTGTSNSMGRSSSAVSPQISWEWSPTGCQSGAQEPILEPPGSDLYSGAPSSTPCVRKSCFFCIEVAPLLVQHENLWPCAWLAPHVVP